jgi:biopolymer transport protein ExbB/TolQ
LLLQTLPVSAAAPPAPKEAPPAAVIKANAEAYCFLMHEVGGQPKQADCEKKAAQDLTARYPRMSSAERTQLQQFHAEWPAIRKQWLAMDEKQKEAIRKDWAATAQQQQPQSEQGVGGSGPSPTP